MAVPYTFGSATSAIPLSQLDSNFATAITLGNTAIQLGNTVTTLNNMTLANVTVSSGNVTVTSVTDSGLTAGRVNYNGTGGLLVDSANLTFDGTNLGLAGGTANGIAYLNGSKVLTTGSALVFDGTNFSTTGSVTASNAGLYTYYGPRSQYGALSIYDSSTIQLLSYSGTTNNAIRFAGYSGEYGRFNSSGQLGIGTTSPSSILHLSDNPPIIKLNNNASNDTPYIQGGTSGAGGDGYLYLSGGAGRGVKLAYNNGTVAATVDGSGNLLVGATTNATTGHINVTATSGALNGVGVYCTTTSSTGAVVFWNSNGQVGAINVSGTATAYVTSSDYRLKNTVTPMTGALAKVSALKPVTYKWNVDNSDGEGFIAHELAEVCPHAVVGEKNAVNEDGTPKYQGIDTSFLVATLTAAIQELNATITDMAAKLKSAGVAGF